MKTESFPVTELSSGLVAEWRAAQRSHEGLAGPCFHPSLYRVMGEVLPDIRVAVLEREGKRAFLPYQRHARRPIALPVPMCDYQAIIAAPGDTWDVAQWLRSDRLIAWDFDFLVDSGLAARPTHVQSQRHSRKITVTDPREYQEQLRKAGKSQRNLATKRRLLERDLGPLRFEVQGEQGPLLTALYEWKTRRFGGFADWGRRAIERILSLRDEGLDGALSALYAGDSLVAIHFGMRGDNILFYWFPTFNPELGRYSPGGLLLQELIAHLTAFGARTLDLGPGGEAYKDYFSNESLPLLGGTYEIPSTVTCLRRWKRDLYNSVRANRYAHGAARVVAGVVRSLRKNTG